MGRDYYDSAAGDWMCGECGNCTDHCACEDADDTTCDQCGAELYHDCQGQTRCEECDPPCPHCYDGGGPGA